MALVGTLYVVGTPIGNLEDVTLRALRVLGAVDVIACEDTRHTRTLLQRHGITRPLVSYHEHNERERAPQLVRRLLAGEDVALVSDAGMPGISDPGFHLVTQAVAAGVAVIPVPGPSAVTAALSVAGLPAERFLFLGFLPRARKARQRTLREVAGIPATLVFFEAPHRVHETLADAAAVLGPRRAALVREATKVHEEVLRGPLPDLACRIAERRLRGEITLVVEGAALRRPTDLAARPPAGSAAGQEPAHYLRRLLRAGMSRRDAARNLAEAYGIPRRRAYQLALQLTPSVTPSRP
ncbi:MAG: 16S rRNA (cytidine(1402)-2'-O)-methyltransferase [Armatimonadota bacterium]|nr:16S rRNA (cytidine(1402)-2'-O)-methyltransferase [Armatimonadota bacterium]